MVRCKNNGFIFSSLFIKEGSRVYAKLIKEGKSEHSLSSEEQEALKKEWANKNFSIKISSASIYSIYNHIYALKLLFIFINSVIKYDVIFF
jgi:hypothetical protein